MHFRFFVEDRSGKIALDHILPRVIPPHHVIEVRSFRGIGHLPRNLKADADPRKRTLLDNLPPLLRAAGKEFRHIEAAVVVIVDLDDRDRAQFLAELETVLQTCDPKPRAIFRFAIEEGEAWLLGERAALLAAYPKARKSVLNAYVQDSICGTWEVLANAIHKGGAEALRKAGAIGAAKCDWADRIGAMVEPARNVSPSFQELLSGISLLLAPPSETEHA